MKKTLDEMDKSPIICREKGQETMEGYVLHSGYTLGELAIWRVTWLQTVRRNRKRAEVFRYEELLWSGERYSKNEDEYIGLVQRMSKEQFAFSREEMKEKFLNMISEFKRDCKNGIARGSSNIAVLTQWIQEHTRSINYHKNELDQLEETEFPLEMK